jgi:GGDEF domain-containing protein
MYALYFPLKVLLGYPIAGENLPITITEILTLLATILIVRQISYGMWDFEETIQNLTFRQIGLPPRLYESLETEELYRELKRSRRLNHPLTVVVMKPDFDPTKVAIGRLLTELQRTMASRYVQARLAKILSETLRDYDLVALNGEEFVILLPEAERDSAEVFLARIHRDVLQQLDIPLRIGLAQFPAGGITLTGLVQSALEDMRSHAGGPPALDRQLLASAPLLEETSGGAH